MRILTAMSGLSARQKICSGDGARCLRGVGSSFGLFGSFVGALEKNLRIPSFFFNCRSLSSSEGADDSSEEDDMLFGGWLRLCLSLGGNVGAGREMERQRKLSRI